MQLLFCFVFFRLLGVPSLHLSLNKNCFFFFLDFSSIDENPAKPWSLSRTVIDSFGAAMVVFLLCDFWRLVIGRLPGVPERLCLPWQNV